MSGPLVSFVIPVRNDAVRLRRCLDTIRRNSYPADCVEIIVADNGSGDGSVDVARQAGAIVLSLPGLRPSALRNAGAAVAAGDIIAFVDADHEIDADWTASAAQTLAGDDVGAVGSPYCPPAQATWVQRMYDAFRDHAPGCRQVEWLASGNLATRREAFHQLHGFDVSLETCEDTDFCQRLRRQGYAVVADDRLRSVHSGDPETLGALFQQELWRGRDNVRASLRGPLTWRNLPSVVIPVLTLVLLGVAAAGVVFVPLVGPWPAGAALGAIALLALPRTIRMLMRIRRSGPSQARPLREGAGKMATLGRAFAVALVYETARALAPVWRADYRRRRRSSECAK